MPIASGTHIGPYEIAGWLGAGGMGEVYRARDPRLQREVAIKLIAGTFAEDASRVHRFEQEARAAGQLNHPNILAVYDVGIDAGAPYIVSELLEGESLRSRLHAGALPWRKAVDYACQIAEGLAAAHDKHIVHRDVKPDNLFVTSDGRIKILDFGIAKLTRPSEDDIGKPGLATETEVGTVLGTAGYMSPEQVRGEAVDARSDIFSLGAILYEMLTGRAAFTRGTAAETVAAILKEDPPEPHATTVPPALGHTVSRCLEKVLEARFQSARDLAFALQSLPADSAPVAPTAIIAAPWRWRTAAGVAVLVLSLVTAAASWRTRGPAPLPTFRELTFRHGTISGARLAADGQTVVYGGTWIGAQPQLYIIRPESPQSGSIGLNNAGIYSVSSRGDLAVALGCRLNWGECLGTLAQVPITGGSPREIRKDVLVADWSPDGQNIAVASSSGDRYQLEYPIGKVLYESPGWITSARVSPRADRIAFLDHPQLGDTGGSVSVVDLNGKKTILSADWKSLQGLAWTSNGDEVWFTGSRSGKGGSSALYAVTPSGRERTVFSSPGTLKLNDISRDGQRVLLTRGTTRGGISFGAEGGKERDLSWFDFSTVADLSSDGGTLLFYEWGEGVGAKPTIFVRKTGVSDAVRIGEGRPLALSPDGQWALAVQGDTPQQLVLLPTGAGQAKRMPRGTIVEFLDWAAWSPDGRRIVFAGRERADVRRTYVQDADGGDPRPITPDGFVGMLLSPDGKTIAAVDRYGEYYLCSMDGRTEPHPLAGYRDGDALLQWSADGRFLFIREAGNVALRIDKLDLSSGARQFWREFVPPDPTVLIDIGSDPGQIRVTPDGRSYAYTYWTFEGELYLAQGLK